MIQSNTIEEIKNENQFLFSIDKNGISKEIINEYIKTKDEAETRAKSEFLEYGYNNQTVEFSTYFSTLNIGDIIEIFAPLYSVPSDLSKSRFIVKRIKHTFKNGEIISTIKGVRYD